MFNFELLPELKSQHFRAFPGAYNSTRDVLFLTVVFFPYLVSTFSLLSICKKVWNFRRCCMTDCPIASPTIAANAVTVVKHALYPMVEGVIKSTARGFLICCRWPTSLLGP